MTKLVAILEERGPLRADQLPYSPNTADKKRGVWKFKVRSSPNGGGAADSLGGPIQPIYYINEWHSREEVVRAFIEANPSFIEAKTYHGALSQLASHGPQWKEPVERVLRDVYGDENGKIRTDRNSGGETFDPRDCPVCGEWIETPIPNHIRAGNCQGVGGDNGDE